MIFEVTILGSNSAIPAHSKHPTSQIVNISDKHFLVDCGEGTQMQMSKYNIKRGRISHIFISHLHGDHYFGLIGLITSYHLLNREDPLTIYGPAGLEELIRMHLRFSDTGLLYPLEVREIDPGIRSVIYEDSSLAVSTIPMNHRIPCCGFLFSEKPRGRKMLGDKLEEYGIPVSMVPELRLGHDIKVAGKLFRNHELTTDPPPPRKYAFCSDTAYHEPIVEIIRGSDLVYHEATFGDDSAERANETFHSTARQAATIALKADAGKLIIGHFSAKYREVGPLLDEAKEVFPNTVLAEEGVTIGIPMKAAGG